VVAKYDGSSVKTLNLYDPSSGRSTVTKKDVNTYVKGARDSSVDDERTPGGGSIIRVAGVEGQFERLIVRVIVRVKRQQVPVTTGLSGIRCRGYDD